MAKTKTLREIPFEQIEDEFELASYWWGDMFCPAVSKHGAGYQIRVLKSETRRGIDISVTYDYFELDAAGTVLVAPRGYAKDFKPGRITGLSDAVARYGEAQR